jgi:ABC-type nitrate/sulfonate/bicarbonate transport system ATPase subunit
MLQKDLLLPWRSIIDNVILGMEIDRVPKAEAKARALPLLQRYGLGGFENRYPAELSGGMRQRAALLRTMLCDRDVILLDEPFAALDAQTRADMQEWLLDVWDDFKKTVIFVTHDVDEGVYLSDEVVMMSGRPGRVVERVTIELARPRKRSIITSPEFVAYKEHFLSLLHRTPAEAAAA